MNRTFIRWVIGINKMSCWSFRSIRTPKIHEITWLAAMGTTLEAEKKNLNQQLLLNRLPADRNISVHQRSADPLASIFILINKSRQTKLSGRVMIYLEACCSICSSSLSGNVVYLPLTRSVLCLWATNTEYETSFTLTVWGNKEGSWTTSPAWSLQCGEHEDHPFRLDKQTMWYDSETFTDCRSFCC